MMMGMLKAKMPQDKPAAKAKSAMVRNAMAGSIRGLI